MGRREQPLDPAQGPIARFAIELRKLRQGAGGLTYRAMAAKAHYSTATLAQAAAGDRLPSLAVALAYAQACGGDPTRWERRWHEAARAAAEDARAADTDVEPPYLGLARFGTDDTDRFFGRDRLAGRLMELIRRDHLVVVAGPSGSGKSSLLRAGLIARLQQAEPPRTRPAAIRILTPGPTPVRTHADVLDPRTAPAGTLIVVDQLEEVFTLCADPDDRTRFLDLLCAAARPEHRLRVVLAVRGDFYGHLAQHRPLAEAAEGATLLVAPMSRDELREAIVKPAALGGLVVERSLTARVIHDVTDAPGGLPLMSHALLETWRRRKGRVLAEVAYDAAGGIHGAIARTAEDLYARLSPDQAETARRILLRLVVPGQGSQDTRCPADRADITALGPGPAADADLVLERLAHARLVTLDRDTVDLSHEAVLAAWPRLRAWIDQDRDRLRVQRHLTEAARAWQALGRDPGALYRGLRLSTAEQHLTPAGRRGDLTSLERQFLTAGLDARHREHHHRRVRTAALATLLVLGLLAGLIAWQQNQSGERRRVEAEARRLVGVADSLRLSDPRTAMRLSLAAWRAADLPETRSALLAATAQPEEDVFTDPDGATGTMRHLSADGRTLVSVGADQVTRWDVTTRRRVDVRPGLGEDLGTAGFPRADSGWLPVFTEKGIALRDLATGRPTGKPLTSPYGGVETGPSGRTLLVYRYDATGARIQLWHAQRREVLLDTHQSRDPDLPADSGDGMSWVGVMALKHQLEAEHRGFPVSPDAVLSADDRLLALCLPGRRLQLWDVEKGRRLPAPWLPNATVQQCAQEQVRFSPDGEYVGLITETGYRTWHLASGRELPPITHKGLVIAEPGDGGTFVVASDGREILLWRPSDSPFPAFRYRLSGETVRDLRLDTATGTLRYLGGPESSWGSRVRTLALGRAVSPRWEQSQLLAAEFSRDGKRLALAHQDPDGKEVRFRLLDGRTGALLAEPPPVPCATSGETGAVAYCDAALAFDSTARTLAHSVTAADPTSPVGGGSADPAPSGRVTLYDLRSRRVRTVLDGPSFSGRPWGDLAFTSGDRALVLAGHPGAPAPHTRIWDLRRGRTITTLAGAAGTMALLPDGDLLALHDGSAHRLPSGTRLPHTRSPGRATALAFSPDGTYLAVGEGSGRVVLWDGALRRRLGELAAPETTTYQYVSALAFSADGRMLAVAGDEGTLQLWDTSSHRRTGGPLPTAGDTIKALAFTPDHGTLHTVGDHSPPYAYDIAPRSAARAVCGRVGKGLSREEWSEHLPDLPYRRSCP
ncbi:helix-turn-helix domain-containing protein [Streptomyces sp. NPDC088789]|uniref:nSTAND1 domain-containing NTPase n=1 Tax=Streptomyces sp. NPDC088789 TaxID=3365899 RepID=UPI0038208E2B